jgi:site-specific DNA recombinase
MRVLGKPVVRAAVYTRKSSDEGLDQEFNSLDAQHEACSAYIASQRHEGWKLIKKRFDDGGISGGTLERPALKALLCDVESSLVDMIVVYKIDRLTRSLSDFAKLIDCLDAKGCSFVSVTQSFNTSSSMGRLTLNVLLSFAQFEREVTAERIRDKIAASKKKGMWMGGMVPWGYKVHSDPKIQSLEICEERSPDIRHVYDLYEQLGCLSKVKRAVDTLWPERNWSRGRIYNILINPIYIGKIRHKTEVYEGLHDAIIEQDQFDRVQEQLQRRSVIKRGKTPLVVPLPIWLGKSMMRRRID